MKQDLANVLSLVSTSLVFIVLPGASWRSSGASGLIPWDGPLTAIASYLTDVAVPAVLKLSFAGALALFALSGASRSTRQLARLGLATGLALLGPASSITSCHIRGRSNHVLRTRTSRVHRHSFQ
jgi:hypothetical protein